MLAHPTLDHLHTLGLHGLAKGFKELEHKPEARSLDHAEWLGLLLEYELTLRRQKQFETRARVAKLRHSARIEDVNYQTPRGLDRLQADVFGEVDAQLARLLEVYAARGTAVTDLGGESAKTPERAASEALTIKPGSVLVRDWGGRTHRVMALEVGFAWEGRNYRSLSEVARAITGTRWNGRRFFGVGQNAEAPPTVSKGRPPAAAASEFTDGGSK